MTIDRLIILSVTVAVLGTTLAACVKQKANAPDASPSKEMDGAFTPRLYIDPDTRCHYLTTGTGLTPRVRSNGTHICDDNPKIPGAVVGPTP